MIMVVVSSIIDCTVSTEIKVMIYQSLVELSQDIPMPSSKNMSNAMKISKTSNAVKYATNQYFAALVYSIQSKNRKRKTEAMIDLIIDWMTEQRISPAYLSTKNDMNAYRNIYMTQSVRHQLRI